MNTNNANFIKKVNDVNVGLDEMSKATHISPDTLSALYHNKRDFNNCKLVTAIVLSEYFGCKIEDLMNRDEGKRVYQCSGKL